MKDSPSGGASGPGWDEEQMKDERSFLIFQCALARRRVEDILKSDDLAMVLYYRELNFVHTVLTSMDGLLRRQVRDGTHRKENEPESAEGEQA